MTHPKQAAPSAHPMWLLARQAVRASFWPVADQAMVSGSNFLTNVVIARDLGAYEFGVFTLIWTSVLFGLSVQLSLITSPMYTLGGKVADDETDRYYGALITIEAVYVAAVFALAYVGARFGDALFTNKPFASAALPFAAAGATYLVQDFVRRCLFARRKTLMAFGIDIVSYPLQLVALLAFVLGAGLTLTTTLWIIAGTSAASAAVGLIALLPVRVSVRDIRKVANDHWAFSRWIVGSIATNWLVLNVFYVVAGLSIGPRQVAGLRGAALLFAAGNVFFLGIENFVPVRSAELLARSGLAAMIGYMRFWLIVGITVSTAISICIAVLAPFWLHLVFGDVFARYVGIVYLTAATYPLSCYVSLGGVLLRSASATKPIFIIWAVMAAIAVAASYPLIVVAGVYGAAAGQLLCYLVGSLLIYRSIAALSATAAAA